MIRSQRSLGFTLIELLASISILSVLSVASIKMIVQVQQLSAAIDARRADTMVLHDLSQRWRRDVELAESVVVIDAPDVLCRLTDGSGAEVVYRVESGDGFGETIHREVTVEGDVTGRQSFRLQIKPNAPINVDGANASRFATLSIAVQRNNAGEPRSVLSATSQVHSLRGGFATMAFRESQAGGSP